MLSTIICIIETGYTGIVQNCTSFYGDDEEAVNKAAEAHFRQRCAEEFGLEWIRLSEKDKNCCINAGWFNCEKFVETESSVAQIFINWTTRNFVPVTGKEGDEDGTSGQDRKSYTDTQDRKNYAPESQMTE